MSHRIIAALAIVALLLAIVLLSSRGCDRMLSRSRSESPSVREQSQQPPESATPVPAERVEEASQHATAPSQAVAPAAPTPVPELQSEKADLAARDWLEIEVVDPEHRPVVDAHLSIRGVRKDGDDGSWYEMRDGPATARTDGLGRARISYVRWVNIDGRTTFVDLQVNHPEFCPFRDDSFPIGEGQHQVVLQAGATVVVRGWVGSPDSVIPSLDISVETEAQLPSAAWKLEPIGRYSTHSLPPGKHLIWLSHEDAGRSNLASAITPFEIGKNETKDLSIELRPLVTLLGQLDESVPRPVIDGHVALNLHQGGLEAREPSIDRDFETVVQPDGTFQFANLPPAHGQIIALCRGWVSRRTRADSAKEAGISSSSASSSSTSDDEEKSDGDHEPGDEDARAFIKAIMDRDDSFQPQRVTLPRADRLVVEMVPTGSVEVTIRTQEQLPLVNATVHTSPNVHWAGVGSTIFPWGNWSATTDEHGHARVENLPPTTSLWVTAYHESFRMTRTQRDDMPSVKISSGETTALEIILEPGGEH